MSKQHRERVRLRRGSRRAALSRVYLWRNFLWARVRPLNGPPGWIITTRSCRECRAQRQRHGWINVEFFKSVRRREKKRKMLNGNYGDPLPEIPPSPSCLNPHLAESPALRRHVTSLMEQKKHITVTRLNIIHIYPLIKHLFVILRNRSTQYNELIPFKNNK